MHFVKIPSFHVQEMMVGRLILVKLIPYSSPTVYDNNTCTF